MCTRMGMYCPPLSDDYCTAGKAESLVKYLHFYGNRVLPYEFSAQEKIKTTVARFLQRLVYIRYEFENPENQIIHFPV